jgi:UDP-glucuronate 4-epimerase
MQVLVTGAAGFIGATLSLRLLSQGHEVWGIDNLNDYYDVRLKQARLKQCQQHKEFQFQQLDIGDRNATEKLFTKQNFDVVIHLAAQAGVRYSVQNPFAYIDSNIVGFASILEGCRHQKTKHLIYASSSSIYGANTKLPFSEHDAADHPISLYAATKRANELMAHSYAHLYDLPCTGLRFFTVYGPWGRPDMSLFQFTRSILEDKPISVFNHGKMLRDFTYVDDIVEGVMRLTKHAPTPLPKNEHTSSNPAISHTAPYRIYNIGNQQPVELKRYIEVLETQLGKKATLEMLPMQAGDVPSTYADVKNLETLIGDLPHTPIEQGVANFVNWYREYYQI